MPEDHLALATSWWRAIDALIVRQRFNFTSEIELHQGLATVFERAEIPFVREVPLGDAGQIDFVVGGIVGIEVKIKGSLADVTRQLFRYAQVPDLQALILITTKTQLARMPGYINDKPLWVRPIINL